MGQSFLGMRRFLILWAGQSVSALGTGLGSFALGVWVFRKTGSTTWFAMISVAMGLALIIMNPVSGALADRRDRRQLLLLSNVGSGLMSLLMAALLYYDRLQPWHTFPIVFVMFSCAAIQGPALLASISLLVPREQLARASGMTQTARAASMIIGPLAAGVLIGLIGYGGIILIDCLTYFFAVATILAVPIPNPPRTEVEERQSLLASLAFGWTYLRRLPGLFVLVGLFAAMNFCMAMVQVLLTPLILSFATPVALGTVDSMAAAGLLLGSIALTVWGGPRHRVMGVMICFAVQALILFLGGIQPSIPLIATATVVFMFTLPFINGWTQVVLQSKVALGIQGRVFGVATMVSLASVPISALIAGPLADRVFEPMFMPGGALAGSVGRLIGVGPGRGIGFLFVLLGTVTLVVLGLSALNPRLRRLETEIPDALPDGGEAEGEASLQAAPGASAPGY